MYSIKFTGEFKRDMRLCKKRGYDMELIREAIRILSVDGKLPKDYLPHQLHGDRKGQWECHIQPNWLLIWEQQNHPTLPRFSRNFRVVFVVWPVETVYTPSLQRPTNSLDYSALRTMRTG